MNTVSGISLLIFFNVIMGCGYSSHEKKQSANAAQVAEKVGVEQYFNKVWAEDKLWDDGLAEVTVMDGEYVIYGTVRKYTANLIVVKELFNKKFDVKTDDYRRDDLFTVLKFNFARTIHTENYPYHFLTSIFFERNNSTAVHKLSQSSQEWCGTTYKQIRQTHSDSLRYEYHSYWDGEGNGSKVFEMAFVEDQLFYTFRALRFSEVKEFEIPLIPSLQSNKALISHSVNAKVNVRDSLGLWCVHLKAKEADIISEYRFEKEYPNRLVFFTKNNGAKLYNPVSKRYAYWN